MSGGVSPDQNQQRSDRTSDGDSAGRRVVHVSSPEPNRSESAAGGGAVTQVSKASSTSKTGGRKRGLYESLGSGDPSKSASRSWSVGGLSGGAARRRAKHGSKH